MCFSKRLYWLILVLGCFALVSCASPIRTHFDQDATTDFSAYRTFAWIGPAPLARAKQGSGAASFASAIDDQRIRRAVEADLEARGYRRVDSAEQADLVVAYSVGSEEKVRVHESAMRTTLYPYPTRYRYGPWLTDSNVIVQQYTEGTLTLEFYDRRSEQAVWVGWAPRRLSRSNDPEALISAAVAAILADFPAAPGR